MGGQQSVPSTRLSQLARSTRQVNSPGQLARSTRRPTLRQAQLSLIRPVAVQAGAYAEGQLRAADRTGRDIAGLEDAKITGIAYQVVYQSHNIAIALWCTRRTGHEARLLDDTLGTTEP